MPESKTHLRAANDAAVLPSVQGAGISVIKTRGFPSTLAHQAYAKFCSTSRFGSLDGLRCLSILAVLWHHGPGGEGRGISTAGYRGVQLFFAISGFLITTLLLRERDLAGRISLSKFYARRALRIFPIYFTVLGIYIVLVGLTRWNTEAGREFFHNLPYFLSYTSNWFIGWPVTFGFAWSLAAEEQFYCGWPWAERYLPRNGPVWLMVALVSVALAWQLHGPGWRSSEPLPSRILSSVPLAICWGVLTAHLLHSERGFTIVRNVLGVRWGSTAMLLLLLALIFAHVHPATLPVVMTLLVASCVIREDHWLAPFLGWRPVVHVGMISYGMYLMHGLVFDALRDLENVLGWTHVAHGGAEFVVAVAGTVALASLSYRYYESFFLGLKKRFFLVPSTGRSQARSSGDH